MIKVFAVTSGKGGVGKSNICANVALSLANLGQKVLLFDADLGLANLDIIYGLKPEATIQDVFNGDATLAEVMVEAPMGVKVIPATSGLNEISDLTVDQKMSILNGFDDLKEDFDFLIVDTGAGISTNVMYFNVASQQIIVVVNKEPTSITDAYALMKVMNERYDVKTFNLLVNESRSSNEALNVYKAISSVANRFLTISINYFGFIPFDPNLQNAVLKRTPLRQLYPTSPGSIAFDDLAKRMLRTDAPQSGSGNIRFFWKRLVELSNQ
ncbi:MAG: hypothetical protein A2284_00705 [Deltaproteobacteria bacterium RIFOXYA12_FULL_61_11]|nr:MAG: hypothetical protein A2284_00705 [Deltaproteobacteria bacterium RIFOXYA12_FULL_61_11]